MKKVKLTKLMESLNPSNPNNRETGEVTIGMGNPNVEVGERYNITSANSIGRFFSTSTVQQILEKNEVSGTTRFRTHNSIYQLEILEDDQKHEFAGGGLGKDRPAGNDFSEKSGNGGSNVERNSYFKKFQDSLRKN